ncbi:hypothetical protein TNCV_103881 [Trichonephila clavipes]|nr:hypothetical protein TNCV_103881 [Trichonephila clavipes]
MTAEGRADIGRGCCTHREGRVGVPHFPLHLHALTILHLFSFHFKPFPVLKSTIRFEKRARPKGSPCGPMPQLFWATLAHLRMDLKGLTAQSHLMNQSKEMPPAGSRL